MKIDKTHWKDQQANQINIIWTTYLEHQEASYPQQLQK